MKKALLLFSAIAFVTTSLFTVGCSDDEKDKDPVISGLTITNVDEDGKIVVIKDKNTAIELDFVMTRTASADQFAFTSSTPNVATISSDGVITGVEFGSAIITATYKADPTIKASCTVVVTDIKVSQIIVESTKTLKIDEVYELGETIQVLPEDAFVKTVEFVSADETIATVDAETGTVTAVKAGKTIITINALDGSEITADCEITVENYFAEGLTIDPISKSDLKVGDKFSITATITPDDANIREVKYTSKNLNVATVDANGLVTAVGAGATEIEVSTIDGSSLTAICEVSVGNVPAEGITVDPESKTIIAKDEFEIKATLSPANTTFKEVIYKSSDESVAKVVKGDTKVTIEGVAAGTAKITATTTDGTELSAVCEVTVTPIIESITVSAEEKIGVSETVTLKPTVLPAEAEENGVTYTSSDNSVATVDADGVVKGIKAGTATITIKAKDKSNVSATCEITVNNILAETLTINPTSSDIFLKESFTIVPTIAPENTTNKAVEYISSDPKILTVTDAGLVTAIKEGVASIIVKTKDGSEKYASCAVTVGGIVDVDDVKVTSAATAFKVGDEINFADFFEVLPANAYNKNLSYEVTAGESNIEAPVDNKAKAKTAGTVTIKAISKYDDTKTASVNLTITNIGVTEVKEKAGAKYFVIGDQINLADFFEVLPANATIKDLDFSVTSGAANISAISDGKVTAIGAGDVTIQAVSRDDNTKTASVTFTINSEFVMITSITYTGPALQIKKRTGTVELAQYIKILPENANNQTLKYSLDPRNIGVGTVDQNGKATGGPFAGNGIVVVETTDGSGLSIKINITVTN